MMQEVTYRHWDQESELRIFSPNGKEIDQTHLVNQLNYLNFSNKAVIVNFRHRVSGSSIAYRARPTPCLAETVECHWDRPETPDHLSAGYEFTDILVPVGGELFLVKPFVAHVGRDSIRFRLPETCTEVNDRKVSRSSCENIQARLNQSATIFNGRLVDFSAVSFCIEISTDAPHACRGPNPAMPINTIFYDAQNILYSGKCRITRQRCGRRSRFIVVEPLNNQIQLYPKKTYRNARQTLTPSPDIILRHPFSGLKKTLKAIDVSGGGFAVEEKKENAALLPGMLIQEMELHFASSFRIKCKAQVIYRRDLKDVEDNNCLQCGLALIDMQPDDHARLLSILYQAHNSNSYLCNPVDLDTLWRFFFETGFIYPEKYGFFQKNKERIKKTYKKLYTETPDLARHFICQDKGRILGHIAMIRFYDKSWLIHHHAARKTDRTRAGLVVLNQIGRFINDSHRLRSLKMDFVFCYYRPENRFPDRVFGGSARSINQPQKCSLDNFAYYHFQKQPTPQTKLPPPWHLIEASAEDLAELKKLYMQTSGGLMLKALNLEPEAAPNSDLAATYRTWGFRRTHRIFAVKRENTLKAILVLNISDIGLNLSDLTNCVTIVVLDPDQLSKETLHAALSSQLDAYGQQAVPVLLYPESYTEKAGIPREKTYSLWILNMQNTDQYFEFIHRLLGRFLK